MRISQVNMFVSNLPPCCFFKFKYFLLYFKYLSLYFINYFINSIMFYFSYKIKKLF